MKEEAEEEEKAADGAEEAEGGGKGKDHAASEPAAPCRKMGRKRARPAPKVGGKAVPKPQPAAVDSSGESSAEEID